MSIFARLLILNTDFFDCVWDISSKEDVIVIRGRFVVVDLGIAPSLVSHPAGGQFGLEVLGALAGAGALFEVAHVFLLR